MTTDLVDDSTLDVAMRVDVRLQQMHPALSRASVQKLIKSGQVSVNGVVAAKASQSVNADDILVLNQSSLSLQIPKIELEVLYEDENCVVINKPLGVLTHSKGAFNPEGTVASWLKTRKNYDFDEDGDRSGIVHRLDRATSGVMICAKNKQALGHLQNQFQTRRAKKTYMARVAGRLKQPRAKIDLPLERNPKQPQRFRVGINGKSALTEYELKKEFPKDSLVELRPTTGRTHQLRVHMNYVGNSIIGDIFYDGPKASRLYLHAASLDITILSSERKTFVAELPKDFLQESIS